MITIKLKNMEEKKRKFISFDISKNSYKVYAINKKKLIHIAYLKEEDEALLLAGLINSILSFHNLENVICLKTYILTKFNNVKRIQEEDEIEQSKVKYKATRKYYSNLDIYGKSNNGSEFNFCDKFKNS